MNDCNGPGLFTDMDEAIAELSEKCGGEVPEDIRGFFGHPLMASSSSGDGEASSMALLHEYQNLPAIDRADLRIHEKYGPQLDTLLRQEKGELQRMASPTELTMLLQDTDVDAFLNNKESSSPDSSIGEMIKAKKEEMLLEEQRRNSKNVEMDNFNQKDTFLLGNDLKGNMPSPLDSLVKDEPDMSPEASDMEFSAALSYPTFDLHHFQDEDSLMEELNNSLNVQNHFPTNESDDFVPNISSNLLRALSASDISSAMLTEAAHQSVPQCETSGQAEAHSAKQFQTMPQAMSTVYSMLSGASHAHQSMPTSTTCNVKTPIHPDSLMPDHAAHVNGETLGSINNQPKPPPIYISPSVTHNNSGSLPPPPYTTPSLDDQGTPPPTLLPIEYMFSPKPSPDIGSPLSANPPNIIQGSPSVISNGTPTHFVQPLVQSQNAVSNSRSLVLPNQSLQTAWPGAVSLLSTSGNHQVTPSIPQTGAIIPTAPVQPMPTASVQPMPPVSVQPMSATQPVQPMSTVSLETRSPIQTTSIVSPMLPIVTTNISGNVTDSHLLAVSSVPSAVVVQAETTEEGAPKSKKRRKRKGSVVIPMHGASSSATYIQRPNFFTFNNSFAVPPSGQVKVDNQTQLLQHIPAQQHVFQQSPIQQLTPEQQLQLQQLNLQPPPNLNPLLPQPLPIVQPKKKKVPTATLR